MTCGVLIPINVAYNVQHNSQTISQDPLRILTLQDVRGNLLYAHVAVSLLFTPRSVGKLTSGHPDIIPHHSLRLLLHLEELPIYGPTSMGILSIRGVPTQPPCEKFDGNMKFPLISCRSLQ
jgi:hypothetical protein